MQHNLETEWWETAVKGGFKDETPSETDMQGQKTSTLPWEVGAFSILHPKFEVPTGNPGENIQKEEAQ